MDQDGQNDGLPLKPSWHPPLSKWVCLIYGIMSLIIYSTVFTLLPELQKLLGLNFGSYATVSYGIASTVGQGVGILISKRLPLNFCLRVLYALFVVIAVYFGLIPFFPSLHDMRLAVAAMFFLGLTGSILQVLMSGVASTISSDALLAFYIGQSLSGIIPLPVLFIMSRFLNDARYILLLLQACCAICCIIGAFTSPLQDKKSSRANEKVVNSGNPVSADIPLLGSIFFVTFVSFALYPREILAWNPDISFELIPHTWLQTVLIYVAIGFDVIGMFITIYWFSIPTKYVPVLSALRILFLPIFWIAGWEYFSCTIFRVVLVASMSLSGSIVFGSAVNGISSTDEIFGHFVSLCFTTGMAVGGLAGHYLGILLLNF
jgi:hypothetical protein